MRLAVLDAGDTEEKDGRKPHARMAGPAGRLDVEVELQEFSGVQDRLVEALGAESPPDVVEVGNTITARFAAAGQLAALDPGRIVPVWSPYRIGGDWSRWAFDEDVPERARKALATGRYHGIGELHLIGGFVPNWRSPVISGLIALGIEYDVPLLLHTEFITGRIGGGLPRGFGFPLFALWGAGAIVGSIRVRFVAAALGAVTPFCSCSMSVSCV